MSESIEINEDLRNLSWEILITRDDLLRIAEKLPDQTRQRAHQTAGRLSPVRANVQRILASLPAGIPLPESTLKNLVDLRDSIAQALGELDDLMKELRLITGEEDQALRPFDVN